MAHSSDESNTHVHEAIAIGEHVEAIRVSTQDFTRILDLLENPPTLNDKLKAAIAALPDSL